MESKVFDLLLVMKRHFGNTALPEIHIGLDQISETTAQPLEFTRCNRTRKTKFPVGRNYLVHHQPLTTYQQQLQDPTAQLAVAAISHFHEHYLRQLDFWCRIMPTLLRLTQANPIKVDANKIDTETVTQQ